MNKVLNQLIGTERMLETDVSAPRARHKILGGKVTLYQRSDSRNWWAEFSITGEGQQRRSLKTDSLKLAEEKAEEEYYEAKSRKKLGKTAKIHSFESVAAEVIEAIRAEVERGQIPVHRVKDIRILERYFIPFFGKDDIGDIDQARIANWIHWRREYWFTGPGKDQRVITYTRNGKELSKPFQPKPVSPQRLKVEHNALRFVFKHAQGRGYIRELPASPKLSQPVNRRPDLTPAEFRKLIEVAEERFSRPELVRNPHLRNERIKLWCFVNVLAYSGMRVTEAHNLRWNSIVWNPDAPIGEQDIYIRIWGKGHEGTMHPQLAVIPALDVLRALTKHETGQPPSPDNYVFAHADGKPIRSFKKGMAELFNAAGVLWDNQRRRRSAGSFRHFYATQQLLHGVKPYNLSKAMRTTQTMIERFYGHVTAADVVDELRPAWTS